MPVAGAYRGGGGVTAVPVLLLLALPIGGFLLGLCAAVAIVAHAQRPRVTLFRAGPANDNRHEEPYEP
jgi:hypothetical protein